MPFNFDIQEHLEFLSIPVKKFCNIVNSYLHEVDKKHTFRDCKELEKNFNEQIKINKKYLELLFKELPKLKDRLKNVVENFCLRTKRLTEGMNFIFCKKYITGEHAIQRGY